ncbi:copper resistance protein CopZ [Roseovarius sp. A46]|uniref:nitrous oxide reductase accessory protein NosL n=1 Tax=Roseovarius sp. A46 TaxID=2109331 RepID=UPI0010107FE7|nr:nitrous oxide reductase accessory protein NosL [Roseovarius sp. A46]RXV66924.1 copper resistance protein CopZ [Roseovarius sp. A46]
MRHLAVIAMLVLAACQEEEARAPDPVTMTSDALGHFCMMQLDQHPGPKAQIHLAGLPDPIFFSQVRDALAYLKGPERDAEIRAVYVSDMGRAPSWDAPGIDNWTEAATAHFVVGADVTGGMGAPEIVPFSDAAAARAFAADKGGEVMTLDAIPPETVLAPVDIVLEETRT